MLKRAISIREKNQGADHVDIAPEFAKLASLHVAQQKWAEAEPLFQKSISILEKEYGPNHINLVPTIESLASAFKEQEKFDKAEPLLSARACDPRKHPRSVSSGNARSARQPRGSLCQDRSDSPTRLRSMSAPFKFAPRPLAPSINLVTNNLDKLASVYSAQEKLVEAEPLYKQSFSIREKETLLSLRSLASAVCCP